MRLVRTGTAIKTLALSIVLAASTQMIPADNSAVQLVVLDPGHFHASLLQSEMYPGISQKVSVFAPLGPELIDYLNRISLFNSRKENPTSWALDIHAAPDAVDRVFEERPGNVLVLAGKNRSKIDHVVAAVSAGMHVLADKPWIISSSDMGKLEQVLESARSRNLVAYDIMTERYEITSILQRALVNDEALFGALETGSAEVPAISAKSLHNVMKTVAGVPLRRPVWFFDTAEYGEGLSDVGTHVVDLVQWTAFPDQALDFRKDIKVIEGRHWPLVLTQEQFRQVTGEKEFPAAVTGAVRNGKLEYFCNNSVHYTIHGHHVNLEIIWNWQAAEGAGDAYEATFNGSQARVELRQGPDQKFRPEVYVVPVSSELRSKVFSALKTRITALQSVWPGVGIEENGTEAHLTIPDKYRVGHEAHFAQVANRFFGYLKSPKSMPSWEQPNMLAKYYVSTRGVELSRSKPLRAPVERHQR